VSNRAAKHLFSALSYRNGEAFASLIRSCGAFWQSMPLFWSAWLKSRHRKVAELARHTEEKAGSCFDDRVAGERGKCSAFPGGRADDQPEIEDY